MMYVDAVVRGLDDLPAISDDVRCDVLELYNNGGLEALREELRVSDPEYLAVADVNNHRPTPGPQRPLHRSCPNLSDRL